MNIRRYLVIILALLLFCGNIWGDIVAQDHTQVGEIRLANKEFTSSDINKAQTLKQEFILPPTTYNYFRVGFIDSKPVFSSTPSSLAHFELTDMDPDSKNRNKTFHNPESDPVYLWYMIKNKVPVDITLSFGKLKPETAGNKNQVYLPYIKLFDGETDNNKVLAEGGWKKSGGGETSKGVNGETATITVLHEQGQVLNPERNGLFRMKIEAVYKASNVKIDTYTTDLVLTVQVNI